MLILGSADELRGTDFFSHVNTGGGFPVALHSNEALPPPIASACLGFVTILGNPDGTLSAEDVKFAR